MTTTTIAPAESPLNRQAALFAMKHPDAVCLFRTGPVVTVPAMFAQTVQRIYGGLSMDAPERDGSIRISDCFLERMLRALILAGVRVAICESAC